MRDGVIADFEVAEEMIKHFIRKVHNRRSSPIHDHRLRAVGLDRGGTARDSGIGAVGGRPARVLIEEPMRGDRRRPSGVRAHWIHGGGYRRGTTEVAVLSLGGIVYSRSVRVAATRWTRRSSPISPHQNLLIGEASSERIKKEIGSAAAPEGGSGVTMEIKAAIS